MEGQGADAADSVHEQQLVELALDHGRYRLQVVGHAGVGLVVSHQDRLDARVAVEGRPQSVHVYRLPGGEP